MYSNGAFFTREIKCGVDIIKLWLLYFDQVKLSIKGSRSLQSGMAYSEQFLWICMKVITLLSLLSTTTERVLIGFPFALKIINYTLWKTWGEKANDIEQEAIKAHNDIYKERKNARVLLGFVYSRRVVYIYPLSLNFLFFVSIWKWKIESTFVKKKRQNLKRRMME